MVQFNKKTRLSRSIGLLKMVEYAKQIVYQMLKTVLLVKRMPQRLHVVNVRDLPHV